MELTSWASYRTALVVTMEVTTGEVVGDTEIGIVGERSTDLCVETPMIATGLTKGYTARITS